MYIQAGIGFVSAEGHVLIIMKTFSWSYLGHINLQLKNVTGNHIKLKITGGPKL